MSRRRLKGWEPREFTEYVYEGDRLVRSVTTREPEFTPDEVALLMANERLEAEMGPHGFPLSEVTDPANQFAFVASDPITDWAAKTEGDAQDAYFEKHPKASRNGLMWSVRKR